MYIAARSEDRAKIAIEDIKQTTGKEAIWLKLDLASLKSVKTAAEEFLECVHRSSFERASDLIHTYTTRKEPELHILFNNACVSLSHRDWIEPTFQNSGILKAPIDDEVTVDGYDMIWGINTLGRGFSIVNVRKNACFKLLTWDQVLSISQSCFCPPFSRLPLQKINLEWSILALPPA